MEPFSRTQALDKAEFSDAWAEDADAQAAQYAAEAAGKAKFPSAYSTESAERRARSEDACALNFDSLAEEHLREGIPDHAPVAQLYEQAARLQAECSRQKAEIYRQAAKVAGRRQ